MPGGIIALLLVVLPALAGAAVGLAIRVRHRGRYTGWRLAVAAPFAGLLVGEAIEFRFLLVGLWDAGMIGLLLGFGVLLTAHRSFSDRANLALLLAGTAVALVFLELGCIFLLPKAPQISASARPTLFLSMDHEGPPEGDLPWSTERDAVHAALTTGLACASIYGSDVDIVPPIDLASDPVQGEDVRRRVLHVGDSFVFGFGVRPSERFTSRLDGLEPRTSNLNAGVEATAPDVYLAVVRRWIALRRVDAVVMYLTFNDLWEIDEPPLPCADYQSLLVYPAGGAPRLRFATARPPGWLAHRVERMLNGPPPYLARVLIRHSAAARWIAAASVLLPRRLDYAQTDPAVKIAHLEAVLRAARDELRAHHIPFVVVLFDEQTDTLSGSNHDELHPLNIIRATLERLDVPTLETLPFLHEALRDGADLYLDQGHLNVAGHALIASWLDDQLPRALGQPWGNSQESASPPPSR